MEEPLLDETSSEEGEGALNGRCPLPVYAAFLAVALAGVGGTAVVLAQTGVFAEAANEIGSDAVVALSAVAFVASGKSLCVSTWVLAALAVLAILCFGLAFIFGMYVGKGKKIRGSITFADLHTYDPNKYGKVVHFKGFGGRVMYSHQGTKVLADITVDFVAAKLKPDTLVWDGDNFQEDSFTALLPKILKKNKSKLVMFLRNDIQDINRVNRTWLPLGVHITCYLCPSHVDWSELGFIALRKTQSKLVVSFGGGAVVEQEFMKMSKDVMFYLVPVKRKAKDGTISESAALEGVQASNLECLA